MKPYEKIIGLCLVLFAIGFNLWMYRAEPTALTDPNDNTFQFALIDRTNQIWSYAQQKCSGITAPFCMMFYLTDHWVPNWAQGYNLPYYYSHLPQIIIVAGFRLLSATGLPISLFTYYHWVIYLLLSLFPLSLFVALRIVGLPMLTAGIGAIIASHLSTDGLYGIDPPSFLWRGYGLTSQLFAMIWLPLALAYAFRLSTSKTKQHDLFFTAIFLGLTTAGHLGLGIIAFLSIGILAISPSIQSILTNQWNNETAHNLFIAIKKMFIVFGIVGLLLGYWIIPVLKDSNYHNISVWDGIWKFDSFGYREVLKNLFNGDLFDFGRFPILTAFVFLGILSALTSPHYASFAFLFMFWLLMYFGRTTWGGLLNIIPGMDDFHISRFIVGVHIAGLFLIPMGADWLTKISTLYVPPRRQFVTLLCCYFIILIALVMLVFPQTLRYASHNDILISRANEHYTNKASDITLLLTTINHRLSEKPGRVFAGRGGGWGKEFRVAETPMYMYLSTYGIPVILWLPETWSPNSDTEQYFSENKLAHYALYNVRYVVTPTNLPSENIQPFWKLLEAGETWKLYEVATPTSGVGEAVFGYITTGVKPAIVSSDKSDFRSLIRLWMHSDAPGNFLYPELTFDRDYPRSTGLPNFRMTDEATYKVPDGSLHNLFTEVPSYMSPQSSPGTTPRIISQNSTDDMEFNATVANTTRCVSCMIILRQTFHPSWQATIDGKRVKPFAVFPFYTAVMMEEPGEHTVTFSYTPTLTKKLLSGVGVMTLLLLFVIARRKRQ